MGYIQEMRALIGHRPLLLPAAGMLIVDVEGRLLLQRRSDDGLWGTPGGAMELGESLEGTARRETFEETGLEAGDITLFGVFSGEGMRHTYPNGDQVEIVSAMFLTRDVRGDLRLDDDESHELRYFSPEELHTLPLNPVNILIVRKYLESLTLQ